MSLILVILAITEEIGLRYKERWDAARPSEVEPRLWTFIPNPSHASYPSNHSFQSFSIAFLMSRIIPEHPGCVMLYRSARRIAENREWAGVHYASDSLAGYQLARMVSAVLERVLEKNLLAAQSEWM